MAKEYVQKVVSLGRVPFAEKVLFYEDFSTNRTMIKGGTGTDYIIEISRDAYVGGYSLRMKTRTTGASAGDSVQVSKYVPTPVSLKASLTVTWMHRSNTLLDSIRFGLQIRKDNYIHEAWVGYFPPESSWYYMDEDGNFAAISGGSQVLHYNTYHLTKLIADFRNEKYVSLRSDSLELDLSSLPYYKYSNTGGDFLRIYIRAYTEDTTPQEVIIDNVLVMEE